MEIYSTQKLEVKDKGQRYSFRCESPAAWLLYITKFIPQLEWKYINKRLIGILSDF